jgi:hypothetical protein
MWHRALHVGEFAVVVIGTAIAGAIAALMLIAGVIWLAVICLTACELVVVLFR